MTPERKLSRRFSAQRGYAMLGLVLLISIAATTLVVASLNSTALRGEQDRKTTGVLALAKLALIGRAAADDNRPGSLPCPDTDNDGQSNVADILTGACAATIGRLPWLALGLPDLRDASGERLWYALALPFSDLDGNEINSNTVGNLNVTGTISAANAAAIVFAPGAPVNAQVRSAQQVNSVSDYIESYVSPTSFATSATSGTYNDQLSVIAAADIFAVTHRRVAREVQAALKAYYTATGAYPAAAATTNPACLTAAYSAGCTSGTGTDGLLAADPSPASGYTGAATLLAHSPAVIVDAGNWFDKNNWRAVVQYQVSPDCVYGSATPPCIGTLSVNAVPNQKAVVGFNGVPAASPAQIASTTHFVGVQ